MASLVQGYNYDIFISYRQKDNKGDRWVSEFVETLKTELESTFKDEISVYFDINSHDGLLETHDVNASLQEKLKCLIFIPIISRTYCDPKSFAWEHEFRAFVEMTSNDQFGLKVKLPDGNVASRVLPVRIYELDTKDIQECQSVLGGALRGIEFIYKEPGVNKPLTPDDDEKKNLNKTKYRIQINKVANAIKELIAGLLKEPVDQGEKVTRNNEPFEEVKTKNIWRINEKSAKPSIKFVLTGAAILLTLIAAAIFVYPKIFKQGTLEKLRSSGERISVAVMPFQNMTNDTTWNVWQDGIQNEFINYLTNSEELKVRQTESINTLIQTKELINYASLTPSVASKISQKLDASIFIYGTIKQTGDEIRINAQLIDSKNQDIIKSFQIDGIGERIFYLIDSLSNKVRDYLVISNLEKELSAGVKFYGSTNSPEAFRYFIYGNKSFYTRDYAAAIDWYLKAIAADSAFTEAAGYLSVAYYSLGMNEQGKQLCLKIHRNDDMLPLRIKIMTNWLYALYFETIHEQIKYLKQYLETDDMSVIHHYLLGVNYKALYQFDNAADELEKSLELSNKLNSKPLWVQSYTDLGEAYHKTSQFKKEEKLYKRAEYDFPDNHFLLYRQAILAISEGKTKEAELFIAKYKAIRKEKSASESAILTSIAFIYDETNNPDKAEEYYRQALASDPENPLMMNNLAWCLFNNGRNVNEGMQLIDKALKLRPQESYYWDTKGWELYKQGNYKEALESLQKSWNLLSTYNYEIHLHLEAAKKAVASQK
jgi:TolB-like protein/Tfp pilus assembly protein PilF